MQIFPRILYIVMWLVLWGTGLVGLAALGFLIDLLIQHQIHCTPPGIGLSAECRTTEDAAGFLIVNGLPWLIPLAVALLIRFIILRSARR